MRRTILVLALAGLAATAVGLALWPAPSAGQPGKADAAPAALAPDERLPIRRVVLFTSGVAFFQREGEVEGSAAVELSFPVRDVNDLLKSLVLRDLGGGQIRAVGYDSHDPLDKTLQGFAVNLSANPSFGQILDQARGEKVEVTWRPADRPATQVRGTILGVERQKQPAGKDRVVEVGLLNLWSADGMRSLKLSEVGQVHFLNPALDREVGQALDVLARGHDRQKKTVRLNFSGRGKRRVQVGYVVEHPVWRTSYRLVLSDQQKPLLQGWALVENPTGEDWRDVGVRLVSGRPISFRMDLYQPLYAPRPLVELEQFASLRPRAYGGEVREGRGETAKEAPAAGEPALPPMEKAKDGPGGGSAPARKEYRRLLEDITGSVPAVARAAKLGEAFQYALNQPLTLPRQKSALLPVVNAGVGAERVSIYNEKVQAAYPLLGLRLRNTTGLHLMQGPITVFDGGTYAGDALLGDVQPKQERLISYAVDLAVEVKAEVKDEPERVVAVRIVKGTLGRTFSLRQTTTYRIRNRGDRDRLVILEHPDRTPEYKLRSPAGPRKGSRDLYRFEVKVPAGGSATFPVVEEREQLRQVVLTNANDDTLAVLLQGPAGPGLKAAVQKAVELKGKLAATERDLAQAKRRLGAISEDQARQRANMKVIPQTDPAYKRYLDKFLAQETQVERLRAEQERLQATAERQRREYERYVLSLTVKD
jgi:hypothetical protein